MTFGRQIPFALSIKIKIKNKTIGISTIVYLEQEIFEIIDNCLDEAKDDVVAVQHVDVGRRLAQPHTRNRTRLRFRVAIAQNI